MKQTKKRRLWLAAVVFWLAVWQAAAMAIGQEVFLVSPLQAFGTLVQLLPQAEFWQRVAFSAGHILLGFVLGGVCSVLLAVAAERWLWVDAMLAPVMQLVKATPVASFIILAGYPVLTDRLSAAAKAKRVNERTNPSHKWVALAIVLGGLIAAVYGIIAWRRHEDFGIYFTLLGLAVVFLFSGTQVIPTMKNNKKAVTAAWENAQSALANVLPESFPLPARYAHPVVLDRMIRVLREGRARNEAEALDVVKADLKALNADVQVTQEEYDEVVAIKPMFLLSDYQ